MKKAKKIMAFLLAMVMVMGMSVTVLANENTDYTITITNQVDGYVYEAYQVFKGDLHDGKLSNITWGAGVNSEALLHDLNDELIGGNRPFEGLTTAAQVAEVLGAGGNKTTDSEVAKAFADVVSRHLGTVAGTSIYENNKYTIGVRGDGYYFVKNTTIPSEGGTYTRYLLEVVKNVAITHKGTVPEVEKKISGAASDKDDAAIGDTVNFVITGTVTDDIENYVEYYYVFTDTMSKGLTLNTGSITVTVGGKDVKNYFYINASTDANGTTLTVGIQDLLALENVQDLNLTIDDSTEIVVSYSAVINENAVVNGSGNSNTVSLEYSNNPNDSDGGTPDIPPTTPQNPPSPSKPTGETPEQVVTVYTTELTILKTDGANVLPGAAFRLEGATTNIVKTTGERFVEDNGNGTYYKLTSGYYTTTEPTSETKDLYVGTFPGSYTMYRKVTEELIQTVPSTVCAEAFVDATTGKLTFTGLSAGTYTITEIVTPSGYNSIAPFDVEITFNNNDGTFTITPSQAGVITVVNSAGSTLPSTGGMGTTIFYVVGGVLVLVAVVLLVTRKRMKED